MQLWSVVVAVVAADAVADVARYGDGGYDGDEDDDDGGHVGESDGDDDDDDGAGQERCNSMQLQSVVDDATAAARYDDGGYDGDEDDCHDGDDDDDADDDNDGDCDLGDDGHEGVDHAAVVCCCCCCFWCCCC